MLKVGVAVRLLVVERLACVPTFALFLRLVLLADIFATCDSAQMNDERKLSRERANVHVGSLPRCERHPQGKKVEVLHHVEKPTLWADAKKSLQSHGRTVQKYKPLPLTAPLIFRHNCIVRRWTKRQLWAWSFWCSFSQADVVDVSFLPLCSHYRCFSPPPASRFPTRCLRFLSMSCSSCCLADLNHSKFLCSAPPPPCSWL